MSCEFAGTALVTMLFVAKYKLVLSLGLWILTIVAWRVSNSHFNPAVTLAFMLRCDTPKRIPILLALCLITSQISGAMLGVALMRWWEHAVPEMKPINSYEVGPAIVQELLGTTIFVAFFLMQTDQETQEISSERPLNCLIVSQSYMMSRSLLNGAKASVSTYGACLNPAIALGVMVNHRPFVESWPIYVLAPLIGSLLAMVIFYLLFKTANRMVRGQ